MDDILSRAKAVMSSTPGRWLILVENLPADLLERPPAAGEWSALGCLRHLLAAEQRLFPARVRAFLEGRDFAAFDPNREGQDANGETPRRLAEEFARSRAESLALLESLTQADLERTAIHPSLGQVTLGQMLHTWAAHDLMHTRQAEQALMQPFVEGCGPWVGFFTGHVMPGAQE